MNPLRSILLLLLLALPVQNGPIGSPAAQQPLRIVVLADGELARFESLETEPAALLAEAGVTLASGDVLLRNGLRVDPDVPLPAVDPVVLQVLRASPVELDGDRLSTTAATVGAALWEMGIRLRISDLLAPSPETPLGGAIQLVHTPARPLTINAGGQVLATRTAAATVGEALQDGGVALQGLDYSIPEADQSLPVAGEVRLVRVEEEVLLEQVSLPFDTLTQPAPDLEIDNQQVVQVGQFGLHVSRVRVRYEDGVEVSRVTEAEWVAVQPSPRILGYGTNIVVRTVDTPGGTIEYWRAVQAFATSYSPCRLGIDACGYTTASGLTLEKGMVGVIRPWYNAMVFSQVYVPGYGVGVIADIGAGVSGQHWIDLGYSDEDWESWSETVTIYFLTPVPPLDQILWVLP